MLLDTRFALHFDVAGDFAAHNGPFAADSDNNLFATPVIPRLRRGLAAAEALHPSNGVDICA